MLRTNSLAPERCKIIKNFESTITLNSPQTGSNHMLLRSGPWIHWCRMAWGGIPFGTKPISQSMLIYHKNIQWKFPKKFYVDSLCPGDAIWRHKSWSTLAQLITCRLMARSRYLNRCWLEVIGVGIFYGIYCTPKLQRYTDKIIVQNKILAHWGRDKMAAIFLTTFINALSWMKKYEFR